MIIFTQLEQILNDESFGLPPLSKKLKSALADQSSGSASAIFSEICQNSDPKINAALESMPIYRLGQLLLTAPFNSPCFVFLAYEFFSLYLQESGGYSIGHRYFDCHPHVQFISKLRRRLVEASEFHTDSGTQGSFNFSWFQTDFSLNKTIKTHLFIVD